MPYTIQELQNNEYFQKLENIEYEEYQDRQQNDRDRLMVSGSNSNGSMELRDKNGVFISYENPLTGLGQEGPWQELVVSNRTINIKTGEILDLIIDRKIKEL